MFELRQKIQKKQQFFKFFISHDLAIIELSSPPIAVMQCGKIVEQGDKDQILRNPRRDYTKKLIAAAPAPVSKEKRKRRNRCLAYDAGNRYSDIGQ